jgi:hypothetical protein
MLFPFYRLVLGSFKQGVLTPCRSAYFSKFMHKKKSVIPINQELRTSLKNRYIKSKLNNDYRKIPEGFYSNNT